ncbi:CU044_5270 family protein [Actinoallomurus sp. CA-150999]|uniref:CU044_5270 family protein n=1 Tax=Actinoallomurus sp. CA-150999 TaxID=3239887 RepID=UPI003D916C4B
MKDIMQELADARPAHLSGAGGIGEEVRRSELGRAFGQPREAVRRRRHVRRFVPAVAAGAVAVTATVLVAGTGGGTPTPGRSTGTPFQGQNVLLAAADEAAKQPMGKYWYTDQISGPSFIVKGGYAVTCAHDETFEWTAVEAGGGHLFYGRDLPARPLTKEDEAAWRRAGSPKSFHVWSTDHYVPCTTAAGSWKPDTDHENGGTFSALGSGVRLTAAQAQNLPPDPAKLTKMFLMRNQSVKGKASPEYAKWAAGNPANAALNAHEAFSSVPLPPKVRAALMRALAVQPGVRNLGTMTDPLGRRAIAIGADWSDTAPEPGKDGKLIWTKSAYAKREVLLFDPNTGEYLGDEQVLVEPGGEYRTRKPGFVIGYSLLRSSGWTNKKPSPPSELPFK